MIRPVCEIRIGNLISYHLSKSELICPISLNTSPSTKMQKKQIGIRDEKIWR
ncbi:Uncharacterized protein dnm_026280 [Desulfonema magnum]|uniref:Uncharacterized protein n=1 Tax=Desulfonema magnum TaxID=45655 RepID=A0A975BK88_9BACT|nr:Uncharacterized protein dnm_026280 [Desulfonema magnum]